MSSLQTVTYATLYNQALNYIKSNCKNIDGVSALPSVLTSTGVVKTLNTSKAYAYYTPSNPVTAVSTSTVNSEFSSFMSARGISASSDAVTEIGVLRFFNYVAAFCYSKVMVATSALTTGQYPVYITNSGYPSTTSKSTSTKIEAATVAELINMLNTYIIHSSKVYVVRYTITGSCTRAPN